MPRGLGGDAVTGRLAENVPGIVPSLEFDLIAGGGMQTFDLPAVARLVDQLLEIAARSASRL